MSIDESGPWRAASPHEAAVWLASLNMPWWIAGGWALDLFAENQSRLHQDLDAGILRKDAVHVVASLAAWEVFEAKDGILTRLDEGVPPRSDVFSLWCRPTRTSDWFLELMLEEEENGYWIYRRQRHIRRPFSEVLRRSSQGMAYLAPEIQLLYKSHRPREKDHSDFAHMAQKLDQRSRIWLRNCLETIEPEHPWLPALG